MQPEPDPITLTHIDRTSSLPSDYGTCLGSQLSPQDATRGVMRQDQTLQQSVRKHYEERTDSYDNIFFTLSLSAKGRLFVSCYVTNDEGQKTEVTTIWDSTFEGDPLSAYTLTMDPLGFAAVRDSDGLEIWSSDKGQAQPGQPLVFGYTGILSISPANINGARQAPVWQSQSTGTVPVLTLM